MSFIVMYVTNPNRGVAEKIGNVLLEKKLVACVNYVPIKSAYWWEGKIENDDEIVALFKTTEENTDAVENEVTALHPYECPCIMKMPVSANKAYEAWIDRETKED